MAQKNIKLTGLIFLISCVLLQRVTDQPHKVADFLCEDENVDTQENKMKSPDMQPDE